MSAKCNCWATIIMGHSGAHDIDDSSHVPDALIYKDYKSQTCESRISTCCRIYSTQHSSSTFSLPSQCPILQSPLSNFYSPWSLQASVRQNDLHHLNVFNFHRAISLLLDLLKHFWDKNICNGIHADPERSYHMLPFVMRRRTTIHRRPTKWTVNTWTCWNNARACILDRTADASACVTVPPFAQA